MMLVGSLERQWLAVGWSVCCLAFRLHFCCGDQELALPRVAEVLAGQKEHIVHAQMWVVMEAGVAGYCDASETSALMAIEVAGLHYMLVRSKCI